MGAYNPRVVRTVAPAHGIWPRAGIGAAMLMLAPTMWAASTWLLGWGRDADMSGVHELIVFFLFITMFPALALAFGVMAPCAIAIDRITAGRTSRPFNITLGAAIGLVGFATFLLAGGFMAWETGESLSEVLSRPFSAAKQPATMAAAAFFAVVGMIIAAGMRSRTRRHRP